MIFFKESEYKGRLKENVNSLLGNSLTLKHQLINGFSGSTLFGLIETDLDSSKIEVTDYNTRCNLEKKTQGILIRINYRQTILNCAIGYNSIKKITINNNEEVNSPFFFSPMWILLRMGVHIRYARYFRIYLDDYYVNRMELTILTDNGSIKLDSSGYNYYSIVQFFNQSKLISKIEIISKRKPV